MKTKELGSFILLGVVIIAGIVGISSRFISKKSDGPIEEFTERFIEDQIEDALGLKNNELKNKIDFSFEDEKN